MEDAVLRGAANAKGISQIYAFSRYVERIHTKAATEQLLAWMNGSDEQGSRLIAAAILNNENHPAVLPALIREWRAYVTHQNDAFQGMFEKLTKLMIANGQTEAMQEVVKDWDRRSGNQRCCIVGDLGQVMGPQEDTPFKNEIKPNPVSKNAKALAIELLIHALEDKSTSRNSFFYCNSGVASQRICDIALWALHQIEPSQYTFTVNAGWRQMEKDRIATANSWRAAHGLEALSPANMSGLKLDEKDSLKITTIEIFPPGGLKEYELAVQISALQDTKLAPDTLPKLLTWFASHKCDGLSGIHVDAIREKDLTGVTLVVNLVTGVYPKDGSDRWRVEISSSTGDDGRFADYFQKFYSHPFPYDSKIWDDAIEGSAKALNASPKTRIVIKAILEGYQ